jgi:hypothetical protein
MRKTWFAIALIALLVGLAAGYRLGRPGKPLPGPTTASQEVEAPAGEAPAHARTAKANDEAPGAPEAPCEPDRWPSSARSDDERAVPHSEGESAIATPEVAPSSSVPAALPVPPVIPGTLTPGAASRGDGIAPSPAPQSAPKTAPPNVPPVAPPSGSATSTSAATEEPAKEKDTAAPVDDPESDRRPPVLEYLRFDPPETKGGGTAILSIGATDDLSGVKLVYGSVRSPSGAASVQFSARDATGSGVLQASIPIPLQAETGDWFVANMQLVDKADNGLSLAFARATVPAGGTLRVYSEDSDSTAPQVHRVSVLKGAVDAGETNRIIVDVDDDRSGVALVTGAFQSPSKAAFIPFTCTPSSPSSWEGDVSVPANADCGEWTLRQLRVVDKANNSAFLPIDDPQIGRVSFVVSGGGQCDSEPPIVDSVFFAPTVVSNAATTTVIITIAAHDDVSGVASISGWIDGPVAANGQSPRISFAATPDARDPEAPMTARITVAQYAAQGIWRVTVGQVVDKAHNTRTYNRNDPVLRDAYFTVE